MKTRFKHIEIRPVGNQPSIYEVWSKKYWYRRQEFLGLIVNKDFRQPYRSRDLTVREWNDIVAFLQQLNEEVKDEDAV